MANGSGQEWLDFLPAWLPGWAQVPVLIVVVLVGTLLFFERLRKRIAGAANGWRWGQSLRANPKGTIAETVNPPVKPGLSPKEQNLAASRPNLAARSVGQF